MLVIILHFSLLSIKIIKGGMLKNGNDVSLQSTCKGNTWGKYCNKTCGQCKYERQCRRNDGACIYGCKSRFLEPICVSKLNTTKSIPKIEEISTNSSIRYLFFSFVGLAVFGAFVSLFMLFNRNKTDGASNWIRRGTELSLNVYKKSLMHRTRQNKNLTTKREFTSQEKAFSSSITDRMFKTRRPVSVSSI